MTFSQPSDSKGLLQGPWNQPLITPFLNHALRPRGMRGLIGYLWRFRSQESKSPNGFLWKYSIFFVLEVQTRGVCPDGTKLGGNKWWCFFTIYKGGTTTTTFLDLIT